MATFSVDSDAVLTATGAIRATADRLQGETAAMLGQLTQLQGSWTGAAAIAFQGVIDRWRLTQRELEAALGDIGTALSHAGSQYAQTEAAASGLFR
ncbi:MULTISPECIES: WXG100 family type VII secretion target [unclassified Microbacterium]|uniref:WXG100 family type VII secretion target n=1 Tax=unclassified Microbacterium TaxID=2609290 RepID=UPI000DB07D10|nr:MAG: WXG100 family type VII secretion target [Microbacterium sp.]PZU36255.1 MAG: WXG100 family type VII secretion target [Microbacterium sp.]